MALNRTASARLEGGQGARVVERQHTARGFGRLTTRSGCAVAPHRRREARYPPANSQHISPGYKAAYTISAEFMARAQARSAALDAVECDGGEEDTCPHGFGAPQSKAGEVYATHTTIGNYTWRYVVGVQLAADFNVSAADIGLGK